MAKHFTFIIGITSFFLLSCKSPEERKIITVNRANFTFQHFSDWKIDTTGEDYNSDALFSIKTQDEMNKIVVMIIDFPMDTKEMLDSQKKTISDKLIKNPTSTSTFTKWGSFKGEGIEVSGKLMGLYMGTIREFIWTDSIKTLFIMEEFYDKNISTKEKDFDLVRQSFQFK